MLVAYCGNNFRRETAMKLRGRLITLSAVLLTFTLSATLSSFCSAGHLSVSVGDWVKYRAVREGPGDMAWTGDWYIYTKGIRIEVLNVSGNNVTFIETKYQTNGDVYNSTGEYDVSSSNCRYQHYYFVSSNLSEGDTAPFPPAESEHADSLRIDRTEQRMYNGANRTVSIAKFNYTDMYFGDLMYLYEDYCWDQKTGFLLELTFRTHIPAVDNVTSVGGLTVQETSLWPSNSDNPPVQLMVLGAFMGAASVITVGLVVLEREKIRGWFRRK
jgi:hypothetical protein